MDEMGLKKEGVSKALHRLKKLLALLVFGLILLPFNNCGDYTESALFTEQDRALECEQGSEQDGTCASSDSELLQVQLLNSRDITVFSNSPFYNVEGFCNDGGFDSNMIIWKLKHQGAVIQDSQTTNSFTQCEQGEFLLRVVFPTGGIQNSLVLEVEIIGLDENNREHNNPVLGRATLNFQPQN